MLKRTTVVLPVVYKQLLSCLNIVGDLNLNYVVSSDVEKVVEVPRYVSYFCLEKRHLMFSMNYDSLLAVSNLVDVLHILYCVAHWWIVQDEKQPGRLKYDEKMVS